MQVIKILQKLLKCKSITPNDDGAIDFIADYLKPLGFDCKILEFVGDNSYPVKNLYARFGKASPNFCFAGHTDVVPIGDADAWKFDPFKGEIHDHRIYGRGVVDMKGAIAAMLSATHKFLSSYEFSHSISFLITGDEEAHAVNGTKKVLEAINKQGEKLDACLVGEPTNTKILGDTIKVGRRGSITFMLTVNGIQGHVAYPQNADNPITNLMKILNELKSQPLDSGSKFFDPSNLEITTIDVGNKADNVIPAHAKAQFNIRFNDKHTPNSLIDKIKAICDKFAYHKYNLEYRISGESFITTSSKLATLLQAAIDDVVNSKAELSTSGGTSDARFIKDYSEVVEFGLINQTAHKVDENSSLQDIENLTEIYYNLLRKYFSVG